MTDGSCGIISNNRIYSRKETAHDWARKGVIQAEPLESRKKGCRISKEALEHKDNLKEFEQLVEERCLKDCASHKFYGAFTWSMLFFSVETSDKWRPDKYSDHGTSNMK